MQWFLQHIFLVLGTTAVVASVVLVLQQRRSPQSAAAWILFIISVPYIALPVFFTLGFRKRGSRFPPLLLTPTGTSSDLAYPHAELLHRLGAMHVSHGNTFRLHRSAHDALSELETLVRGATQTVDILLYVLADDDSGRRFVRLVTERARQGVNVRLCMDRLGSMSRPQTELKQLVAAGGQVQYFHPFIHVPDRGHLNLRNHRKLVVADGQLVWSGGRNVGDSYLLEPDAHWVDLSYSVSGPVVGAFCEVFASDWRVAAGEKHEIADAALAPATATGEDHCVQLVAAGPDEPSDMLHEALVCAIYNARERVWIATPYFVPTERLMHALATAVRRGKDVRIIIPERSNQRTADLARGAYLRELVELGARVLRLRSGMMHAKAGLIDDFGWVGSANFDVRSMLLNFEISLLLYDTHSVHALREWLTSLQQHCTEGVGLTGVTRRFAEHLVRLTAPLL